AGGAASACFLSTASAIFRPPSSATRSATASAASMSCVITSDVTPSFFCSVRMSSLMRRLLVGSSPVVGSSYKMISGPGASARAAAVGPQQPDDELEQHALAGARRPEHRQRLALDDVEIESVVDALVAERLVHTLQGDRGFHHRLNSSLVNRKSAPSTVSAD